MAFFVINGVGSWCISCGELFYVIIVSIVKLSVVLIGGFCDDLMVFVIEFDVVYLLFYGGFVSGLIVYVAFCFMDIIEFSYFLFVFGNLF